MGIYWEYKINTMSRKYVTKLNLWVPYELKEWMKNFQQKTGINMTSQIKQAMLDYKSKNDEKSH